MKKILIILLAIVSVIFFFYSKIDKDQNTTPNTPPQGIQETTPPEGWKKYTNYQLGLDFYTPPEFVVEANGQYSITAKHPSSQTKVGNIEFFYVSVVPQSLFGNETGEVYNYQKSFHQKLMSITVGEIKDLSTIADQKDWYMYERSENMPINGKVANVFHNQRPWEFPAGTWEYRYIFEFPNKIVLAGGYVVGGPSNTPLALPIFQKIMSTLVIAE